ncbi:alpha/beta fold hydrolase [Nonomuraea glycinis]|uniref:alpha/beta fold hydrolase n=1 Tax=Nonomuraea glycinis TaxID=2047744 RepID=UPI0033B65CD7
MTASNEIRPFHLDIPQATHGWPSSPIEFLKVIGPLTDPRAHGGDPADAFHLVIPSLPGYGLSPLSDASWGDLFRVAQAWAELMSRLGYDRYAAQGTDAGSGVSMLLPMVAPEHVIGVHINGPGPYPLGGPVDLDGLSGADLARAERFNARGRSRSRRRRTRARRWASRCSPPTSASAR